MYLICPHNNLSRPEANELLQLTIVQTNSFSEKSGQVDEGNDLTSLSTISSISQNWAELKEEWRAYQRLANSK